MNSQSENTDLKLENVLYDIPFDDDQIFRIFLGDLGSVNDKSFTYLPRKYNTYFDIYKDVVDETVLSWGLGMLLFSLMNEKEKNNLFAASDYDYTYLEECQKKMDDFYGEGFGKYINAIPKYRKPLSESLIIEEPRIRIYKSPSKRYPKK